MDLFRISFSPGTYQVKVVREVWACVKSWISDGEIVSENFKKDFFEHIKDFAQKVINDSPKSKIIEISDTTTQVGYVIKINNGQSGAIHFHPIKRVMHSYDRKFATLLPCNIFKEVV